MSRAQTTDTLTVTQLIARYELTVVSNWEWKKIRHAVIECATYYFRREGVLDEAASTRRVGQVLCVITRAAAYVRRHGGDLIPKVIAAPDVLQAVVREESVDHAYSTVEHYIFTSPTLGAPCSLGNGWVKSCTTQ